MSSVSAMLKTLNAQLNGYESLLELLKREKGLLIDLDSHGVEEISKEKDTLVLRLRLLEEERFRIQKKLAMELAINNMGDTQTTGFTSKEASFSRFDNMPMFSQTDANITLKTLHKLTGVDEFNVIRLKLVSLIQSVEEINSFNKILIDRSLSYIRSSVELYSSFGFYSNAYNTGNLIAREA
ncbi:MAG: flagellar export chaperone FlgN [Nitrospirae bacterium]|nr:flagellar export chaperone FlgN [Nitrospirota bacterium]MBF0541187.1 flagellar export chaperone FlgN [Nitrospirota bacterium]